MVVLDRVERSGSRLVERSETTPEGRGLEARSGDR